MKARTVLIFQRNFFKIHKSVGVLRLKAIILAGGLGKRMGGNVPKPLVKLLGKPLVKHVYDNVKEIDDVDGVIIVVNPMNKDMIRNVIEDADFVVQKERLGTAHALSLAIEKLEDSENVLVVYSDTPLIRASTMKAMIDYHNLEGADITFLSGLSSERFPYALVTRDEHGEVIDVEEHGVPQTPPPWEYSIGTYVFKVGTFREIYKILKPRPETGERYIPDSIKLALQKGYRVLAHICLDDREYLGVNTPEDLERAERTLLEREVEELEFKEEEMIRFGTGGWRAVIGRGFTTRNLKRVAQAIALYLIKSGMKEKGIVVGYDNRFMSEEFAKIAVEVFAGNNIKVWISKSAIPTPLVTFTVLQKKAGGGVVITASHNPPEYNGLKFETSDGMPAPIEVTESIEKMANDLNPKIIPWFPIDRAVQKGFVIFEDFRGPYLDYLEEKLDVNSMKRSHIRVCFDTMYGSGTSTIQMALISARCDLTIIHGRRDPLFGGRSPAPSEEALTYLIDMMKTGDYDVGIAVDGDADRIALVDEKGTFLHPNDVIAVLYYYLHEIKGMTGPAVRNVATSHNLDRLAHALGERVIETPVGFKHIAKAMIENNALIGGESSGGITFRDHIMEKDGVYTAMLVIEMLARTGLGLHEILEKVKEISGKWMAYYQENLRLSPELRVKVEEFLKREWEELAGKKIVSVNRLDGLKLSFENGSWLLLRMSGTEPLLRIISEAEDREECKRMIERTIKIISEM